jgi:hypothetical protein
MKHLVLCIITLAIFTGNVKAETGCEQYALDAAAKIAELNEENDKINLSETFIENELYLVEATSGNVKIKYTVQTKQVVGTLCIVQSVNRL